MEYTIEITRILEFITKWFQNLLDKNCEVELDPQFQVWNDYNFLCNPVMPIHFDILGLVAYVLWMKVIPNLLIRTAVP